jgi:hypothetical protein
LVLSLELGGACVKCIPVEATRRNAYTYDMAQETKHEKPTSSDSGQADPVQAAIEYGIDVSMLRENLARSCGERIMRHQIALDTAEKLRKARRV